MKPGNRAAAAGGAWFLASVVAAVAGGCKSDLNQQLLERELRYQEDQIYELQDELQEKCARLERVAGENASLRRQLGVAADDPAVAPRSGPVRPRPATAAPGLVPPAIEVPELPRSGVPTAPLAPPVLEGVPPLPDRADGGPAGRATVPPLPVSEGEHPLALPPAAMMVDPAARPAAVAVPATDARRLSFEAASVAPTRLVVNAARTACIDSDGDGVSEGVRVVFETRDAEERLVATSGDVEIVVFDAAGGGDAIGTWRISAAAAGGGFRRTGRDRGLSFMLPWQAAPPAAEHVRVVVRFMPPAGAALEADATIAAR